MKQTPAVACTPMGERALDLPFWKSEVMDRESVFFIKDERARSASAALLFPPKRILCVARADRHLACEEGRDYTLDAAAEDGG